MLNTGNHLRKPLNNTLLSSIGNFISCHCNGNQHIVPFITFRHWNPPTFRYP